MLTRGKEGVNLVADFVEVDMFLRGDPHLVNTLERYMAHHFSEWE